MATINSINNNLPSGVTVSGGVVSINSGTNTLDISNDASATTVTLATGGAVKGLTVGSTNSTSSTTVQSGSGALALTSTNGTWTGNSGTGALGLSTDATNTTISLGTGAGVKAVTLGSTNTTSSTTINFGGSSGSALSTYIASTSFTPVIKFGGGTTGITYGTQEGEYARIGSIVVFRINIVLTNKGSSTGTVNITGLPVATQGTTVFAVDSQSLTYTGNYVDCITNGSATVLLLRALTTAASASNLTDTAFSNTTALTISGAYLV